MKQLTHLGRAFVAIAMIAFGIQHFIYLGFVTRAFPSLPNWIPAQPILAGFFGAFLCITGVAILLQIKSRTLAILLGSTIILIFLIFLLPVLLTDLTNAMVWTNSGKALVLAGANFLVADSFPAEAKQSKIIKLLTRFTFLGRFFLVGFFILAAILHFVYAQFVATLIPNWIPAHLFWTYFAAVALIAGAIGMIIPKTMKLAASLSALMVFLWVVLLHFPRATANLHDSNETTALFEALAMCGMALLIAVSTAQKTKTK